MPNWNIHNKYAKLAGIEELIATIVNRHIDYGLDWALNDNHSEIYEENDSKIFMQLKYFHKRDREKKYSKENLFIKAFYLHHLLDFFRETRVNIYDLELVFKEYIQNKIIVEFFDKNGNLINFQKDIEDLFQILRENRQEFYEDLIGKKK